MNGSRNKTAPAGTGQSDTDFAQATNPRDRKSGGGMLKKLKSRRNQSDKWPVVTEDQLRALGKDITPDHVLGLRAVTQGLYHGVSTVAYHACRVTGIFVGVVFIVFSPIVSFPLQIIFASLRIMCSTLTLRVSRSEILRRERCCLRSPNHRTVVSN